MPAAAAFEQRRIGGMDARITAPDTVEITVTATSTASSLTAFVAGGAVFHVPSGRLAVVAPPRKQRMIQWHPNLLLVAIAAKTRSLVALSAVRLFTGSFQTVRKPVVQVVDVPLEIIPAMALQAACLAAMTGGAPLPLGYRSLAVSMAPAVGMDIGQRVALAVAKITGVVGGTAIVTVHAQRFAGHKRIIDSFALVHAVVTTQTGQIESQVKLVIEFNFVGLNISGRFLRIMMAHVTGFVVIDIMAITTGAHVGQVVIGAATAALYLRMAYIAGCFRFAYVEGVREYDITLRLSRICFFTGDGKTQGYE